MNNEADNNLNYKYSYDNWIDSSKDYDFNPEELDNYLKEETISSDDYNLIHEKQEKAYDNAVKIRFRYLVNLWKHKIRRFPVEEREAQQMKEIEDVEAIISKPFTMINDIELNGERLKDFINRVDVHNEKDYYLIKYSEYKEIEELLENPEGANVCLNTNQQMKSNLEYKYFLYNYNVDDAKNKETANIALSEEDSQASEEEDLRTKIISEFDNMCPKEGWKSGFMYEKQFYRFVDTLVCFFEEKEIDKIDTGSIVLKGRSKTKIAGALNRIYFQNNINCKKLKHNSQYFDLIRSLNQFADKKDQEIYNLMGKNTK